MGNRMTDSGRRPEQGNGKARKESILRTAGFLAGALVWWCVLYPELCFPQDTYEAVGQEEEENLRSLLQVEEEQVIVKSRLLEWLEQHGYIGYIK